MRVMLATLIALNALAGCGPQAKTPSAATPPASLRLICATPFTADSSKASLIAVFGAQNVVDQDVSAPDGGVFKATVLFPDDPKRRVEIAWGNEPGQSQPSDIAIEGRASDWAGPHGLRLGMSVEDAEKINKRPFAISGFDWDYGGYVVDWNGGALSSNKQGCGARVRFAAAPGADVRAASGDAKFASNAPAMRAAHATIVRISIGYPIEPPH